MKLALFSGAILMAAATSAFACPDYSQTGETYNATGDQLYSGFDLSVTAGGSNSIANCNIPGVSGAGYVVTVPDFSFYLSGMGGYDLEVTAEGSCDTVLLVNTPTGAWLHDDDSAGNLQPTLRINQISDGRLDVWVGSYDGSACPANLHLETW
ncbi:hypothetical protein [Nioella nitratireducens]|uniref:hypothetical protein n=1 Tax=Nioella nitratireducens TaxID=1287720 RepID=UPI0008FD1A14|nr:hypothetical protein [Nioella nitratireducens]